MLSEKRCSGCGEVKPLAEFHRHPNGLGGRTNRCKPCKAEYERAYRERTAATRAVKQLAYREANRDREAARARAWHAANRERALAAAKAYYENEVNAERIKARARAWVAANPERKRESDKRWREQNREAVRAFQRLYRERTKGDPERKARDVARMARRRAEFRASMFERDQGICGLCGQPVSADAFHIDHIVPVSLGGEHSVENMQLAHPRCNRSKGGRLSK